MNDAERTFPSWTWKAGAHYDSPIGLIFASASTGFKAGGFNDGCEIGNGPACNLRPEALYYDPERITAYEGGVKFELIPELSFIGTVFHYDYNGLQLSTVQPVCGTVEQPTNCQVTTNAAGAKVDGVELDVTIRPLDKLKLRLTGNFLNARYSNYFPTGEDANVVVDFAERSLNRSPQWTWSARVQYTIPVGYGEISLDAQTRFSSPYELTDFGNYVYFSQPTFTKTDVSANYASPDNVFFAAVFLKNLENSIVLTGIGGGLNNNGEPDGGASFADPRTFGFRAGVNF